MSCATYLNIKRVIGERKPGTRWGQNMARHWLVSVKSSRSIYATVEEISDIIFYARDGVGSRENA